jgi:glycosyltransferase involved in cell wall biosynthesis
MEPDLVIVAAEDVTGDFLRAVLSRWAEKTIVLAQTPNLLPWGKGSYFPESPLRELIPEAAGVVGCSRFICNYLMEHGIPARLAYLPVHTIPATPLGNYRNDYVAFVNPARQKGIDVFIAVADGMPVERFCAVPLWATSEADLRRLRGLANVDTIGPFEDMDSLWSRTRVLLMPSTWTENFPLTMIEAMLQGIPVICSDVGGLPECSLGVAKVVPTRAERTDANRVAEDWIDELEYLQNAECWSRASSAARRAAIDFVGCTSTSSFLATASAVAHQSR